MPGLVCRQASEPTGSAPRCSSVFGDPLWRWSSGCCVRQREVTDVLALGYWQPLLSILASSRQQTANTSQARHLKGKRDQHPNSRAAGNLQRTVSQPELDNVASTTNLRSKIRCVPVAAGDFITQRRRRSSKHSGSPHVCGMRSSCGLQAPLLWRQRRSRMHLVAVVDLGAMHQKVRHPFPARLQTYLLQPGTKGVCTLLDGSHSTLSNNSMPTNRRIHNLNGTRGQPIGKTLRKVPHNTFNVRLHTHRQLTCPNTNQANTATPSRHVTQHGFPCGWPSGPCHLTVRHHTQSKGTNQHQNQESKALVEKLIYLHFTQTTVLLLVLAPGWLQTSTSDTMGARGIIRNVAPENMFPFKASPALLPKVVLISSKNPGLVLITARGVLINNTMLTKPNMHTMLTKPTMHNMLIKLTNTNMFKGDLFLKCECSSQGRKASKAGVLGAGRG